MKKLILAVLIAVSTTGAIAPSAHAAVVVVVRRHHRHWHHYYRPATVWVPGHWQGHFWNRHWVPGHYAPV